MKKSKSAVLKLDGKSKHIAVGLMKPFANRFVLLSPKNKAKKNRVNLNYWAGKPNLGDAISPVVVEYMLGLKGTDLNKEVSGTKHLYAIGSIAYHFQYTIAGDTDRCACLCQKCRAGSGSITRIGASIF